MNTHLIEGEAGCHFAVEHDAVVILVDALRASATAAMLLDAGAREILVTREVEEALAAKREQPDALLFGERQGLPPVGFDFGNSPQTVSAAKNRRVIFTTTTGAGRLVSAWGAHAIYMGTTVNASAVAEAAASHGRDIVLIPAGLAGDPQFDAQEDWAAATVIALRLGLVVDQGRAAFTRWSARIAAEGVASLFASAPHAAKLRAIGLETDIDFCAQEDITGVVARVAERNAWGIVVRSFASP